MDTWQKLDKSLDELNSIPLNNPEDAKRMIEAAYIIGLIQSDPDNEFPTTLLKFI